MLIFLLGMFVFFIGERELASRLEVIVALFLALTGGLGVGFEVWVGGVGVWCCGERGLYVWVKMFSGLRDRGGVAVARASRHW